MNNFSFYLLFAQRNHTYKQIWTADTRSKREKQVLTFFFFSKNLWVVFVSAASVFNRFIFLDRIYTHSQTKRIQFHSFLFLVGNTIRKCLFCFDDIFKLSFFLFEIVSVHLYICLLFYSSCHATAFLVSENFWRRNYEEENKWMTVHCFLLFECISLLRAQPNVFVISECLRFCS